MEYQYKLRPHHGMCIAFFGGKGYSSEFVVHMSEMINRLEKNPLVCLTAQTDEVCFKCPNNQNGICETAEKVAEYDRQVLERCNLTDGIILPYMDFKKAVYEQILIPNKRKEICWNCQWNEICHFDGTARW